MSPSARSSHSGGLANVVDGEDEDDALGVGLLGVGLLPTGTSCHCWLVSPWSLYCCTTPPSAVEALCPSIALPLLRLMKRTYPPDESARLHCWLVPPLSVHCLIKAPS